MTDSAFLISSLLSSVSRSFYLSMGFLPKGFREGVSFMYLLARTTDTIADTAHASGEERLRLLEKIEESLRSKILVAGLNQELQEKLAPLQEHLGEKKLLSLFEPIFEHFLQLPPPTQRLIEEVLSIIIQGQCLDLKRFDCVSSHDALLLSPTLRGLASPKELEDYTYSVAGCVGEFWTKLGYELYGKGYSYEPEEQLLLWGKHFGQSLQLINILRDQEEDVSRGRAYFPPLDSHQLPFPSLQAQQAFYTQKALEGLHEALNYAGSLRSLRLRFATGLPALLGMATLKCCENWQGEQKPKITRREVYKLCFKALWMSCFPRSWQKTKQN